MKSPVFHVLYAALIGSLALSGCRQEPPARPEAPTAGQLSITDDAGNVQTFAAPPARIIPLAPNLTELLFAIGAAEQVAAVSLADDYPSQIDTLPRFSSFPMDYEALVALRPDVLVATDAINNPNDAEQFTSLGLPVLYYSFRTLGDIPRVMQALGELTGNTSSANAAAETLENRIQNVSQTVQSSDPVRVLFLIGADQLYAFGSGNYIHEVIAKAGGESLTADLEAVSPILSEEFILTAQPEVIAGTFRSAGQLLEHHPALENVPALASGRVCIIPASLVLRPGPRLVDGIEALARCLHPTQFTGVQTSDDGQAAGD